MALISDANEVTLPVLARDLLLGRRLLPLVFGRIGFLAAPWDTLIDLAWRLLDAA